MHVMEQAVSRREEQVRQREEAVRQREEALNRNYGFSSPRMHDTEA